jgi:hypothetical protein
MKANLYQEKNFIGGFFNFLNLEANIVVSPKFVVNLE